MGAVLCQARSAALGQRFCSPLPAVPGPEPPPQPRGAVLGRQSSKGGGSKKTPELGFGDRIRPGTHRGGPSWCPLPGLPTTRLLQAERGAAKQPPVLMELPGLPNPSQLSECLDWEVRHLKAAIWKGWRERGGLCEARGAEAAAVPQERAGVCAPGLPPSSPNLSKHPSKRNRLQNSWSCQKPPLWAESAWF